jgi:hypothetical protein
MRRRRWVIAPAWKTGSGGLGPVVVARPPLAGLDRSPQRDRLGERVVALDVHPAGLAEGGGRVARALQEAVEVGPHQLGAEDPVGRGPALERRRQALLERREGARLAQRRQQREHLRVLAGLEVLSRLARPSRRAEVLEELLGPPGDAGAGQQLAQQRAAASLGGADEVGQEAHGREVEFPDRQRV